MYLELHDDTTINSMSALTLRDLALDLLSDLDLSIMTSRCEPGDKALPRIVLIRRSHSRALPVDRRQTHTSGYLPHSPLPLLISSMVVFSSWCLLASHLSGHSLRVDATMLQHMNLISGVSSSAMSDHAHEHISDAGADAAVLYWV